MVSARSHDTPYRTTFSNDRHTGDADNTPDKGGRGAGFRPHELLEAALATCMNMWVRMYADEHGLPLASVITTVRVNRDTLTAPVFEYSLSVEGPLTEGDRARLLAIAHTCPVRRTLSGTLSFRAVPAPEAPPVDPGSRRPTIG